MIITCHFYGEFKIEIENNWIRRRQSFIRFELRNSYSLALRTNRYIYYYNTEQNMNNSYIDCHQLVRHLPYCVAHRFEQQRNNNHPIV